MMEAYVPRQNPEARIQKALIKFLAVRGWTVMVTHGNMYQQGFPDLYIMHPLFGTKWVEVKNPGKYRFTAAQLKFFPYIARAGARHDPIVGIWILTAATKAEYEKLFGPPNWYLYV